MRILFEEHFYWALVVDRYVTHHGQVALTKCGKLKFPGSDMFPRSWLPALLKYVSIPMLKKQAYSAGIGRHTQEEVEAMGMKDLAAVAELLGSKPFMFGDEPTTLDCVVFGFTCMLLYASTNDCVYVKFMKENCLNLIDHNKRVIEKCWKDWDSVCSHVSEI